MITQLLLDFVSLWAAGVIGLIPVLPPEVATGIGYWNVGIVEIANTTKNLGVIVPFDGIFMVIQWHLALVAFWALTLPLRLIMWIANR